ncbi:hypothetical protein GCM10010123_28360 [Pilimelia anulata]|uniref:Uncharacterized protein n=1 Tax=Pilimelia anulata TaxID=53371 RepID=A0A8J3FAC7_9ACTN|nr:type I polyketide synthase [Pilimelia anulata]GGJ96690.1 hypothetical protein GCM10010123_28360 [Pilimelia anulata]
MTAEPVAVVGLACRLPGADDPAALWDLLARGGDAVGPPPPGRDNRRPGGYLADADGFDAAFFGIPPAEAAALDPQQRLLLELAWHAIEDARLPADRLAGTDTAVYIGASADDHAVRSAAAPPGVYTLTGTARAFLANRVSYALDLRGPSLTVDTGQSSSLTAVHQAVRSIQHGECGLALAGGVQLNLRAGADRTVEAIGALSPHARCRTFDAAADGYVRGEGGAVAVLKPLRRALADGDRIHCRILATAANHGGRAAGPTTPSAEAQHRLLTEAYARAGLAPAAVGYVELHGTGTPVGDPVEAAALGAALGRHRPPDAPLLVGSIKTNIGHLEGAAGIAGFLKAALAVRHRRIPPSLHFHRPAVDLAALGLRVCAELRDWPAGTPAVAGVSSFGMGGSNCHVILASPPDPAPATRPAAAARPVALLLGGHDAAAVRRRAADLADHLATPAPAGSLADVALSLADTRAALPARAAVVAADRPAAARALRALAADAPDPAVVTGARPYGRIAFLLPGQGAQRPGMGRLLYGAYPAFARSLDRLAGHLSEPLGVPLTDLLWHRPDLLDNTAHTQPAVFAVTVATCDLLRTLGIVPDLLVGHSLGELTAAYLAGALPLADACRLVVARGRLMGALPPGGAMVAVQATEEEAHRAAAAARTHLSIAAVNGPRSVVLSGTAAAVGAAADHFAGLGRRTRRLRVSGANHSALMDPAAADLRAAAAAVDWRTPSGPTLVSALTGDALAAVTPDHWARHLRAPVRFAAAVRRAHDLGARLLVEAGPGHALTTAAAETVPDATRAAPLGDPDEPAGVARLVAAASLAGVPVDWRAAAGPARLVDLPRYPFARPLPTPTAWTDGPIAAAPPAAGPTTGGPAAGGPTTGGPTTAGPAAADPATLVLDRTRVALGWPDGTPVDPQRAFTDLGLDSRMAVALRDDLARRTGRELPATLLFDHPNPAALAAALRGDDPL